MEVKKARKILIVCEGNEEEVLHKIIFQIYPISLGYDIYQYKTNVHLFWKFIKDNYLAHGDKIDNIDVIQLLKEYRHEPFLDNKFTDILLIFDFDPQDARFNSDGLCKLQNLFSESTDQGQLYINYPMIESLIDFSSLPDPFYNSKEVSKAILYRSGYKNHVKEISFVGKISNISEDIFPIILNQTFIKFRDLVPGDDDEYMKLLKLQIERFCNMETVFVLNTSVLFLKDYNFQIFFDYIKR